MTKIISYIHLIGCILWTLFAIVIAIIEIEYLFDDGFILVILAGLATTCPGIYLFLIGRNRLYTELETIKVENEILESRIKQITLKEKLSDSSQQVFNVENEILESQITQTELKEKPNDSSHHISKRDLNIKTKSALIIFETLADSLKDDFRHANSDKQRMIIGASFVIYMVINARIGNTSSDIMAAFEGDVFQCFEIEQDSKHVWLNGIINEWFGKHRKYYKQSARLENSDKRLTKLHGMNDRLFEGLANEIRKVVNDID